MTQTDPPGLDFLAGPPEPVGQPVAPDPDDLLPQAVADGLLKLDGVDGAWIERDAHGQRFVVLHYSRPGSAGNLPTLVNGLPVRVVGGEPIKAGG